MSTLIGDKEFFKGIGQIKYEGPEAITRLHLLV